MSSRLRVVAPLAATILLLSAVLPVARAATAPPAYDVTFLGNGSPVAINAAGTIAGLRVVGTSGYEALVSVGGAPWSVLPRPAGSDTAFPTDLNDAGVIVGNAYTAGNAVGVRWVPGPDGYAVEVLPRLAGDPSSYATGINDLGQVVGARRSLGYVPAATTGWMYSEATGVVDLAARYGLFTAPLDINDAGLAITSTEVLDLTTGTLADIGQGPASYNRVANVALNDAGQVAGEATLRSSSLNIVSAFRYDPGNGWTLLAGTTRYTTVSSINALGDVGYGERGAGVSFADLGQFAVGSLLTAEATAAGWAITGSGVEINDGRLIGTTGRNALTGQAGGVLLTPRGTVQPPAAPVLTGVPHPWAPDAPWDAISLSWTRVPDATSYVLERRGPGQAAFSAVTPNGGTIQTNYDDTAITLGATYSYRVYAVGILRSAASNEVTVTAPGGTADTQAPVVTVVTPAPGAVVKGTVRVHATATDNAGVVRMELRTASGRLLASSGSGSLTYDWSTRGLKRGSTQTLTVRALDAAGNVGTGQVVVRIGR